MNKRDAHASLEYFGKKSSYRWDVLDKYRAKIGAPDTSNEHRASLQWNLFVKHFEAWITDYSADRAVDELVELYGPVVRDFVTYHKAPRSPWDFVEIDSYAYSLWLVGLGVVTDLDDEQFDELLEAIGNQGRDAVYDRLVRLRRPDAPQSDELMYPEPYEHLWSALQAPDEGVEAVERFLDGWYDGMKGTYWHGLHNQLVAGYFGYWCFELAAFVRELDIDDASFIDHPHYPSDLVHWDA